MALVILYFAIIVVAFFFLIVRPQRRQLAARRALVESVEVGDEVITAGGIYGTVVGAEGDVLELTVADGVVLTVAREAIARRRDDAGPADPSDPTEPAPED
jgi:preprotein translocase subunit YajC